MSLPLKPKHSSKRQAEINKLGKQILRTSKRLEIMRGKLFNLEYSK